MVLYQTQCAFTNAVLLLLFLLIHSGREAKVSQKSECNHCTSQEPHGEKERNGSLRCERKTPENHFRENPCSAVCCLCEVCSMCVCLPLVLCFARAPRENSVFTLMELPCINNT